MKGKFMINGKKDINTCLSGTSDDIEHSIKNIVESKEKAVDESDRILAEIMVRVKMLSECEACQEDGKKMRVIRFMKAALDVYFTE